MCKMSRSLTRLVFLFVAAFVLLEIDETEANLYCKGNCRKKSCGIGFTWNPLIRKCVLVKCPDGKKLDDQTGKCVKSLPKRCGTKKLIPHPRISNGETARKAAWPWLATVYATFTDGNHTIPSPCGGALISSGWVLTAAHCIEPRNSSYQYKGSVVTLGEYDTSKYDKEEIRIRVSKAIPHRDLLNDIALLKLENPVDINSNNLINTICLPDKTIDYQRHTCFAAGWGNLNLQELKTSILQEVEIPIVNQRSCKAFYQKKFPVNDDMLCAGTGYKGACVGDSGSPLVCEVGNQWHVVGITSRAEYTCSVPEYPGVYTRVTSFLDWIGYFTK